MSTAPVNGTAIFQDLYHREGASLLRYLMSVPPYITATEKPLWSALQKIAAAGEERLLSLERLIEHAAKFAPTPIDLPTLHFPTRFAALNYISLTYVLPELLAEKRATLAAYQQALDASNNLHYFALALTEHQSELDLLQSLLPPQ